jgi:hypothetical protein
MEYVHIHIFYTEWAMKMCSNSVLSNWNQVPLMPRTAGSCSAGEKNSLNYITVFSQCTKLQQVKNNTIFSVLWTNWINNLKLPCSQAIMDETKQWLNKTPALGQILQICCYKSVTTNIIYILGHFLLECILQLN